MASFLFQRVFASALNNSLRTRPQSTVACLSTINAFTSSRNLATKPFTLSSLILRLSGRKLWSNSGPLRYFSSSGTSFIRYRAPTPPPPFRFLGFLDSIPNAIFYTIIGLNALVFAMWYMAREKAKQFRDSSSLNWMYRNFTNSLQNLSAGRLWTVVTCCFSHMDIGHILLNGFTFVFMARPVLQILGGRQFIFLYLGGGIVSAMTSLFYARVIDRRDRPALGASGAIYSIVTLLACVAPTMTFRLYGIIPIPAWLAVAGLFTYDTYSTATDKRGTTDTVGHIGGMLAGVAYFLTRRFRMF